MANERMIRFNTTILQFDQQGEKTGWSYILIPAARASQLKPDNRRSFRVKGFLDEYEIKKVALLPMGEGDFIMPLNATMRKAIRKRKGDKVKVGLEVDSTEIKPPRDLMECLADEPMALKFFSSLSKSHQNYYGNWVRTAKTEATRTKRIAQTVTALSRNQRFNEMMRAIKEENEEKQGWG